MRDTPDHSKPWAQHPVRTLHGCVETLASAFRGYLPWPEEARSSVVRGHEALIEDTVKRADACLTIIEHATAARSEIARSDESPAADQFRFATTYESKVSGALYTDHRAAGDVSAIIFKGVRFEPRTDKGVSPTPKYHDFVSDEPLNIIEANECSTSDLNSLATKRFRRAFNEIERLERELVEKEQLRRDQVSSMLATERNMDAEIKALRSSSAQPVAWLYVAEDEKDKAVLFERATSGMYRHGPYKETPLYAAPSARLEPIPEQFAQLATFYDVKDMAALVRIQEERIESMRQKLPALRGPESDPQNYRRG